MNKKDLVALLVGVALCGIPACAGWRQTTRAIVTPAGIAACQELARLQKAEWIVPICTHSVDQALEQLLSHQRAARSAMCDAGVPDAGRE